MSFRDQFALRRALRYLGAIIVLAIIVGVLRQKSIIGGLAFGLIIGTGAALGLLLFEIGQWYRGN